MPAIALWTPEDGLLGALAPLAAALAAAPALVIDLDPDGPQYPGERSLADLVRDDPAEADLRPGSGVAVLRNGGVQPSQAADVVAALLERWPRVVLRLAPRPQPEADVPVIPVRLLLGGWLAAPARRGVWQKTPEWSSIGAEGVVLPIPRRGTIRALAAGHRPLRSRWIAAWRSVWGSSWMA
jgi:hypothetical protein